MLKKIFKKKNKTKDTITIASGGTGGHIFPALVVAEDMIKAGYKVVFMTDSRFHNFSKYFQNIIENENFTLLILSAKQPKSGFFGKVFAGFRAVKIIYIAFNLIKIYNINLVIGFGSYTSLPVIIAAFLRRIPSMIHEQNAFIGFSNRIASIFTKVVMTTFHHTKGFYRFTLKKAVFVGMPIRKEILELYYENQNDNINYYSFFRTNRRINILILGGSQGASIFSKVFPETLKYLSQDILDKLFVYHQCRAGEVEHLAEIYKEMKIKYHVNTFFQDAGKLMTMAHFVISRSGAGTLCDLAICGTPSILVPLRIAKDNHQMLNAKNFYEKNACVLLEERDFTSEKLSQIITSMIENDHELSDLSNAVKKLAILNAHEKIIAITENILHNKPINLSKIKNSKSVKTSDVGIG